MGGGDGVEKVDGCVPLGMVAVDVEELAAGAVEVVERRLVGIDGGAAGTQKGPGAQTSGNAGAHTEGHCVFEGRAEGVPAVEGPTRPAEPATTRAFKHGVLDLDSTGLEPSLMETADKSVGPPLLNEATCSSGGDSAATRGSWGTELDPVVPTLFPKDGGSA